MPSPGADTEKRDGAVASTPDERLTPAMRQYVEQKRRVGDAILLFRMGDFYETFYRDAILCSKVLGIALTSRSKGADPIPLAGIPYHALDTYLGKLVAAGYKVAVSEQLEDPKHAKGVVQRDVVRIVTAGTLTDEALLSEHDDNTLAAICFRKRAAGCALVELAGGRFEALSIAPDAMLDELVRTRPAELIIDDEPDGQAQRIAEQLHQLCGTMTTRRALHEFSTYQARKSLQDHFGVATLAGFGFEGMDESLCAAGCLIQYLQETQKSALRHLTSIRRRRSGDYVQVDHNSWRALEIERTLRGNAREGTLLSAIDRTIHPIGSRKLAHWLRAPLTDPDDIRRRQDAVAYLVNDELMRTRVRDRLKRMADVERIAGRAAMRRATPRDLHALGRTLRSLPHLAEELAGSPPPYLSDLLERFQGLTDIADLLEMAIRDDPPALTREGGFIADGFDTELDRMRAIGRDGRSWLADFQRREAERTGISTLKVGFNRVFGYYLEIPNSGRKTVPPEYVRRQTVKNAERYITEELKNYETEVLTAQENAVARESVLFDRVCEQVADRANQLLGVANAIGRIDCVAALAELAVQRRYVRPEIVDEPCLEIRDGRHPVLDRTLGDEFVPNDTVMDARDARLLLITGPNMAGKSTYIRQVALLTLLAQTGSFVPANSMKFSLTDRVFARVGALDEIMRGQSTFMVEMTEAANILHNATDRSLVVLDEIGRGTSTFDGLSLAWAITEHLTEKTKCRALVATHYHELTELHELLQGVRNYNVAVQEYPADGQREGGIIFLHRIVPGGADKSYGVHVARLAGVPLPVIQRSREVLEELQRGFERESRSPQLSGRKTRDDAQLMLFTPPGDALLDELRSLDPHQITPLEALQRIKAWQDRFTT